ncbi:hypothetical protein CBL_20936, partial [Carabus blaptoides fortunei]
EFPKRSWQKLGKDLFFLGNKWYLLVMDYYSRYPELAPLTSLKEEVIQQQRLYRVRCKDHKKMPEKERRCLCSPIKLQGHTFGKWFFPCRTFNGKENSYGSSS